MGFGALALIFSVVFVAISVGDDICHSSTALDWSSFDVLQSKLRSISLDGDRVAYLTSYMQNITTGLYGNQTVALLKSFSFTSSKTQVLQVVANHLLGLSCADAAAIVRSISFSSEQITALKTVVDYVVRSDLNANNATIVNVFTFSSDKDAARDIIANSKPISCTFGPIPQQRVIFIIDVSGSMSTTFSFDGTSYTRLSFVQRELDTVIRYQLAPYQFFNLETFSASVAFWAPNLQPVNNNTISTSVRYAKSLTANGGTNTGAALQAAYSQQNVLGIYLLSDGVPDNPNQAYIIAQQLEARQRIPIFATALAADPDGKAFMQKLATISGGVYREINGQ